MYFNYFVMESKAFKFARWQTIVTFPSQRKYFQWDGCCPATEEMWSTWKIPLMCTYVDMRSICLYHLRLSVCICIF